MSAALRREWNRSKLLGGARAISLVVRQIAAKNALHSITHRTMDDRM